MNARFIHEYPRLQGALTTVTSSRQSPTYPEPHTNNKDAQSRRENQEKETSRVEEEEEERSSSPLASRRRNVKIIKNLHTPKRRTRYKAAAIKMIKNTLYGYKHHHQIDSVEYLWKLFDEFIKY